MALYTDDDIFGPNSTNDSKKLLSDEDVFGPPERTVLGTAKDVGITALKGAIGVGEMAQGLVDIPTGGRFGKFTESLGYKPKEAREILDKEYSPAQQAANREVEQAEGFMDTVGAAGRNPSTIVHAGIESLPLMGAGGVVGRGLVAAAPKVAPWIAGAVGEGVVGAGSAAEQTRQQSDDGTLSAKQSAMAVGSGLGTGIFNLVGGRLAQKFGFSDPDTLLVQGMNKLSKEAAEEGTKGVARRIIEGGISEGVFEELPQSAQEQIWQNAATEKPLLEGVGNAAAMGLLTGAAMGAGVNLLPRGQRQDQASTPSPDTTAPDAFSGPLGRSLAATTGPMIVQPPTEDTRLAGDWADQVEAARAYNQQRNAPATSQQEPVDDAAARNAALNAEMDRMVGAYQHQPTGAESAPFMGTQSAASNLTEEERQRILNDISFDRNQGIGLPVTPEESVLAQQRQPTPEQQRAERQADYNALFGSTAEEEPAVTPQAQQARPVQQTQQQAPQVQAVQQQPAAEGQARGQKEPAKQPDKPRVSSTLEAIKTADAGTLETMAKAMPDFLKENPEYRQYEQLFRREFYARRQALSGNASGRVAGVIARGVGNESGSKISADTRGPGDGATDSARSGQGATRNPERAVEGEPADVPAAGVGVAAQPGNQGGVAAAQVGYQDDAGAVGVSVPLRRQPGETLRQFINRKKAAEAARNIDIKAHEAATSPANEKAEPTPAQRDAGNYAKGHVKLNELDISIENPQGSERKGVDKQGKPWSVTMKHHYGYIKGTIGPDKDHVDVFIGPNRDSGKVFVVDQVDPETGKFDEPKVILGAKSKLNARHIYLANYEKGWKGVGAITEMSMDQFKEWAFDPRKSKRPAAGSVSQTAKSETQAGLSRTGPVKQSRASSPQPAHPSATSTAPSRDGASQSTQLQQETGNGEEKKGQGRLNQEGGGSKLSRASLTPWSKDFPRAFSHTTVSKVTNHPDFGAAKGGDLGAARRLVRGLVKPDRLRELAQRFEGAVVVPVEEIESSGANRIPYALAEAIAAHGLSMQKAESAIYQASAVKRKGLDAVSRLKTRKAFSGEVVQGGRYIIADDILTQGGTVHELRTHIVNGGGEVVAVSSLAFSAGSNIIAIKQDTVDSIISRFGREQTETLLREHNVAGTLEALTESEGRAIARFKSFDALRSRLAEEDHGIFSRVNESAIPEHQVRLAPQEGARDGANSLLRQGFALDETQAETVAKLEDITGIGPVKVWNLPDSFRQNVRARGDQQGSSAQNDFIVAERIAKAFGKEIAWVTIGDSVRVNGLVAPRSFPGTVFIDPRSDKPAHVIFGHELLHWMQAESKTAYRDLYNAVSPLLIDKNEYARRLRLENAGDAIIHEEMIADLLGDAFNDPSFWAEVAKQSGGEKFGGIAKSIMRWINSVLDKIKGLPGFGSNQYVKDLRKAKFELARATRRYADEKGVATGEGVMRSVREMFAPVDTTNSPAFKKWFGDSAVTEDGKPGGKPLVINGLYVKSDKAPPKKPRGYKTGAALRAKVLKERPEMESMSRFEMMKTAWEIDPDTMMAWDIAPGPYFDPKEAGEREFFLSGLAGLKEPELAIGRRRGTVPPNKYSKNHTTGEYEDGISVINLLSAENQFDKAWYDATLSNQKDVWVWGYALDGDEFYGSDGETLLVNASVLSEANIPSVKSAVENTGSFSPTDPRIRYSASPFKPVDPDSPALKRWLGNSQVTEPVFHGSPEMFWTFDLNRAGRNTSSPGAGLGFFFTGDPNEARGYAGPGGDTRSFYVKLENPRRMNSYDLPQFRSPEEAKAFAKRQQLSGYDGIILKDEGYFVVFEPTQVKSAEINTGDFDAKNPDVRYSKAFDADMAEAAEAVKEAVPKNDIGMFTRLWKTFDYTSRLDKATRKIFQYGADDRRENKVRGEDFILDGIVMGADGRPDPDYQAKKDAGFVSFFNSLKKQSRATYDKANAYLLQVDRDGSGFSMRNESGYTVTAPDGQVIATGIGLKEDARRAAHDHHAANYGKGNGPSLESYGIEKKDEWVVVSPSKRAVVGGKVQVTGGGIVSRHATEQEAVAGMMEAEARQMRKDGYEAATTEAVMKFRTVTNRAFDVMANDLRRVIDEAKRMGLDEPTTEVVDEAKRYVLIDKDGNKIPDAYYADKKEAEQFAKAMQYRGGVHVKRQADGEIRKTITLSEAISMMGDLRGSYFPRQRKPGAVVMIAVNEETGERIRKNYDLYAMMRTTVDIDTGEVIGASGIKKWLASKANRFTPLGREKMRLEKQGFKVEVKRDEKVPESVFEASRLMTSIDALIEEAGQKAKESDSPAMRAAFEQLNKLLVMNIADIYKSRGYLSSRIKRSEEYWEGFETDMLESGTRYAKGLAAGVAKREAAQKMTLAITGREMTWQEFKVANDGATWEDYQKQVEQNRLDPVKQPNLFRETTSWMQEMLRNDEQIDRIMGTIKGLAVLKFLGFRASSAAVNMINLVQAVPATIASRSGISITRSLAQVGYSATKYAQYRRGKLPKDEAALFVEVSERGWDSPQFNHDAAAVLRSKAGNAWATFTDAAMFMFGAVEKVNRAVTIHAAYTAMKQQHPGMSHAELMDRAHRISDEAHGIYGKEGMPVWARGAVNPLRLAVTFQKFQQNYIVNMSEMWGRGHRKEFAWMLLSPAIIAGTGATLAAQALALALKAMGVGGDDPEEEFYKWAEQAFGEDSIGARFVRHGLAGTVGVNLKGSIEMGFAMPTTIPELIGAPGALFTDALDAAGHAKKGEWSKAVEKAAPTALAAPFRAVREYREGATTGGYSPVWYGDEPIKATGGDAALRFFGFNPSGTSAVRERLWSEKRIEQKYQEDRKDIYDQVRRLVVQNNGRIPREDWAEILGDVARYNERARGLNMPGVTPITGQALRMTIRRAKVPPKKERQRMQIAANA